MLAIAKQFRPKLVAIFETSKGGTQRVGDFSVTMTHAFHSNSIEDQGQRIYGGEPAGLVVQMPGGATIYHAGDTALCGDMKLIGELYQPQLAMLPIGDLMGPREAACAVRFLGVKHVVPMHYATFPVLTGTPEKLEEETRDIGGLTIHAMKPANRSEFYRKKLRTKKPRLAGRSASRRIKYGNQSRPKGM